jgi:hypothetical protein
MGFHMKTQIWFSRLELGLRLEVLGFRVAPHLHQARHERRGI